MKRSFIIVIMFVCFSGVGLAQNYSPKIGYLYPAGGQQGTTFTVVVGGQNFRAIKDVSISGEGVSVKIIEKIGVMPNLNKERRYLIAAAFLNTYKKRLKESGLDDEAIASVVDKLMKNNPWRMLKKKPDEMDLKDEEIPGHPLLMNIEGKSLQEIRHAQKIIFAPFKYKQKNRQLAESVVIEVTIDSAADLGERKLRLSTGKKGLSNSMTFQVSKFPEKYELEPNDVAAFEPLRGFSEIEKLFKTKIQEVPFVQNGQIMPGDVDRFSFKAKKGQKLLIEGEARRLVPYLADAVPGWFQAIMALYDSDGNEVAFSDDHLINPDPVIFYEVLEDGEYELEVRDAIYRGREDFVYRLSVRDAPWAKKELARGSKYGDRWTRRAVLPSGVSEKDIIPEDVRSLPKAKESADNDTIKGAQRIPLPVLLDGCIMDPEDVDIYKVTVGDDAKLAVEVFSRRLGSPLDSVVKVTDKNGKIIAVNDDFVQKYKHLHIDANGILTHHADSRLVTDLPGKGDYYIHVMDAQNAGGPQYGYRVRISNPMPGFTVIASPSIVSARKNEHVPVILYADRRDGYKGAIEFEFDESSEFAVTGGDIPEGEVSSIVTVQTKNKGKGEKTKLNLKAVATVGGKKVSAEVKAAERVMQAFLFEHLVPEKELSTVVRKEKWGSPFVDPIDCSTLELKPGESKLMKLKVSWVGKDDKYEVSLDHAPEGISVDESVVLTTNKVFEFTLSVDKDCKPQAANITASVWTLRDRVNKEGKKRTDKWRSYRTPAISLAVTSGK